jgi:hypothetical protein
MTHRRAHDMCLVATPDSANELAMVRSRIRSRSNSASALNTWKVSRPPPGRRVDAFVQRTKPDVPLAELLHGLHEVDQRAARRSSFHTTMGSLLRA